MRLFKINKFRESKNPHEVRVIQASAAERFWKVVVYPKNSHLHLCLVLATKQGSSDVLFSILRDKHLLRLVFILRNKPPLASSNFFHSDASFRFGRYGTTSSILQDRW